MGQGNSDAVILRYASIAAKIGTETDPAKLAELNAELKELETAIGKSQEKILSEAAKLVVRE